MQGRTIMLQGVASDVGKSLLTTALCRILRQEGYRVAPFKSQNMSNNSYVTPDGREIGRAQGMQADACGIAATTDMNPILLKPGGEMRAQVVVHGRVHADMSARRYREDYLPQAAVIVQEALGRLREQYDVVVLEGAGSPAEVNLKDRDIVNMRVAAWADAPVLLVADIDRGGVFASIVGTLEILTPQERARVKGLIINKFRGDVSLLQPGIDWLEARTGKPVLGVIPYLEQLALEDEDSLALDRKLQAGLYPLSGADRDTDAAGENNCLDIAVMHFPRIANFTDVDPFFQEPDVRVRYLTRASAFGHPDAVIIPGSKNTLEDLQHIRDSGLAEQLTHYVAAGGHVVGLCGGYQMLGKYVRDPMQRESQCQEGQGLGYLPLDTVFAEEKRTVAVQGVARLFGKQFAIAGYEIHLGRTTCVADCEQPFVIGEATGSDDRYEGAISSSGRIWGTYIHGIFHNDALRTAWLNTLRAAKGWQLQEEPVLRYRQHREEEFDRLAAHVRKHLRLAPILDWLKGEQV